MYGQNARQMYKAFKESSNQDEFLKDMLRQNPMLAQVANSGIDLQQVFYGLCRQRGVNPQDILNDIQR